MKTYRRRLGYLGATLIVLVTLSSGTAAHNAAGTFIIPMSTPGLILSGSGSAVIDGVSTPGEWSGSGCTPILVNIPEGGTTPGEVCAMNDESNLYVLIRFARSGPDDGNSAAIEFDNDHGGWPRAEGDDIVLVNPDIGFFDEFRTYLPPCPTGVVCAREDVDTGGVVDGAGVFANDGTTSTYEFSHPLNSNDDAHDFSLGADQMVGFDIFIRLMEGATIADTFFPSALSGEFGNILIARVRQDVVLDFGSTYGAWTVAGATWTPLHSLSPVTMVRGDLDGNGSDDLVVNFAPGIGVYAWMNDTTWTFLHPSSPSQMVTGDLDGDGEDDIVFVFPGWGVWRWSDGNWTPLHNLVAAHLVVGQLDGVTGDDLILDFPGVGLWVFANNTTWSPLHGLPAAALLTADLDGTGRAEVVIDFGAPNGVWVYRNGATWSPLHPRSPAHMAAGDLDGNGRADLLIDFGPGVGLWTFRNDTSWGLLHPFSTEGMVLADRDGTGKDEVVIDFGPTYGLWQYANDNAWSRLHPFSSEGIVAGRFH